MSNKDEDVTDVELRKLEEGEKEETKTPSYSNGSSNLKSSMKKTGDLTKTPSTENRKAAFQNHQYVRREAPLKKGSSGNSKSRKSLSKSFRMTTNKSFRIMTTSSPALRKQNSQRLPLSTWDRILNVLLMVWHFLSPYRIMWLICMGINSVFLARAHIDKDSYFAKHTSDIALANILACIVVRNEVVLYGLYWIIVKIFKLWPLWFRNVITNFLLHLGGCHSGLGTAGFMWIVYITVELFKKKEFTTDAILSVSVTTAFLLFVSIVGAFPLIRFYFHNQFELMHRFGGWTALAMLWASIILSNNYNPFTKEYEFKGENFYKHQNFWYCVSITWFVVQPWLLFTRKVKVEIIVPSPKMCLVKFSRNIPAGTLARISRAPLLEWHAFGIISEPVDRMDLPKHPEEPSYKEPEAPAHYFLVTALGDFTRGLISDPPKEVWTRTFKFVGLPYCVPLYKSGICVATGSGLGITLSSVLVENEPDIRKGFHLIWVARDIEKEFGDTIMGLIRRGDPKRLHVYDSKKGRPDVMKLLLALVKKVGAEVVFCTSNRSGTDYIINGCKKNGITCFGPIFDS